ncbi:MAG: hypothetical protein ABSG21_17070 [Spirochaetia bacterium]|jgi:hypothetical protein
MTKRQLLAKRNDYSFARLVDFNVNRHWNEWAKVAGLPDGKPINSYMVCIRHMILSQIRKGLSVIKKRERAAARLYRDTHREYIKIKGPRGWRTHRVPPPSLKEMTDSTIGTFDFNFMHTAHGQEKLKYG